MIRITQQELLDIARAEALEDRLLTAMEILVQQKDRAQSSDGNSECSATATPKPKRGRPPLAKNRTATPEKVGSHLCEPNPKNPNYMRRMGGGLKVVKREHRWRGDKHKSGCAIPDDLLDHIRTLDGHGLYSINAIARDAGVSPSTVSFYLLRRADTREYVFQY